VRGQRRRAHDRLFVSQYPGPPEPTSTRSRGAPYCDRLCHRPAPLRSELELCCGPVRPAGEFKLYRGQRRRASSSSTVAKRLRGSRRHGDWPPAKERAEEREVGEEKRGRRHRADMWSHRHVAATSANPPCKTAGWPKVNNFKSSMANDSWFSRSMVKTKL
jgi:hypothetical protein